MKCHATVWPSLVQFGLANYPQSHKLVKKRQTHLFSCDLYGGCYKCKTPQNLIGKQQATHKLNDWLVHRQISCIRREQLAQSRAIVTLVYTHITLHYITSHYITLHYTTLHYITSHYITLHYITLHYTTLHHMTLRYVTVYIALHDIHCIHHMPCHATMVPVQGAMAAVGQFPDDGMRVLGEKEPDLATKWMFKAWDLLLGICVQ